MENNLDLEKEQMLEEEQAQEKKLADLGSETLANERRKILSICFLSGGIGLIISLLIFGGFVVMHMQTEKTTVFVAPPPTKRTYEPRKLEHKVKVQKRQRSSSRPTMVPRMVAMKKTNMSLQEITMDPKVINTSFQPKFKSVSGKGVGAGLGTGYGVGGFGSGVNKFDFFGIRGKGDKVAILVDTSTSMVEEGKGGEKGYTKVKARVNQVIDALSDGALFNVITFADAADALFPKLLIANEKNKNKAKEYLKPFNSAGNWGLSYGNVTQDNKGLYAQGGTTRLDLALTAAFQNEADTILIISDGAPQVLKGVDPKEMEEYAKRRSAWMKKNQSKIKRWSEKSSKPQKTRKVWVPPQKGRPPSKKPPKEGEAPDMGTPDVPGHWVMQTVGGGYGHRPEFKEKPPEPKFWTIQEFLTHLKMLHKYYYLKRAQKPPTIHCIGYKIDGDGNRFLRAISKAYKGRYRRVQSIKIK
jgi:hypothetical protein